MVDNPSGNGGVTAESSQRDANMAGKGTAPRLDNNQQNHITKWRSTRFTTSNVDFSSHQHSSISSESQCSSSELATVDELSNSFTITVAFPGPNNTLSPSSHSPPIHQELERLPKEATRFTRRNMIPRRMSSLRLSFNRYLNKYLLGQRRVKGSTRRIRKTIRGSK